MLQWNFFVSAMTWNGRGTAAHASRRRTAGSVSLKATAFFVLCMAMAPAALAGTIFPGQYQLLDHPDGQLTPPPYGLRVDSLGYTFSVETGGANIVLDWDGGATASITGTLWNNQLSEMWTVDYQLTGVVAAPANLGFSATAGSGLLTSPLLVDTVLTGEPAGGTGPVFEFLADGHRLGGHPAFGDADTPVGRGWILPVGSTDDWLVRATLVPEPGTALLLGLGLAGLAGTRRR